MKNLILTIIAFIGLVICSSAQNAAMTKLSDNLEFLITNYPQTKIFVHTDKPYYAAGEDLWFSVYAVNASDHSLNPVSSIVYIVLENSDGKIVQERNLKLNGKFTYGDIDLSPDLPTDIYVLKAYTSYMRNYNSDFIFSKEIPIWATMDSENEILDQKAVPSWGIKFFPEGGSLVDGLNTKVAFEVSDPKIEQIEILDENDQLVVMGKVISDGIGLVNYTPILGQDYHVQLGGKNYQLPEVKKSGCSFNINTLDQENIYIEISSSEKIDLEETFVLGHIKGSIFLRQDDMTGHKATFKLDRASLPEGVSQVTLFDQKGNPLAERAFFVKHKEKDVNVTVNIPFQYFNKRQEVALDVAITESNMAETAGTFSVSIVDNLKVLGLESGINIESYLLLASEFTSGIKNLNQYFGENTAKSRYLLDLLMLTRGWTRFNWEEIENRKEPEIEFIPEEGFTISGRVLKGRTPLKAKIDLSIVGSTFFSVTTESNEDGYFRIFGLNIAAGDKLVVSAYTLGKKEKRITRNIELVLDEQSQEVVIANNSIDFLMPSNEEVAGYLNTANQNQTLDSIYNGMSVELESVSITASRKQEEERKIRKERGIAYSRYDSRVFMDSMTNFNPSMTVFDVARDLVPGINVVGPRGSQTFRIRGGNNTISGSNDALVLLDGSQVSYELVNTLNIQTIAFIDVLRGLSSSTIYNAPNGIVAIYTRTASDMPKARYVAPSNVQEIIHDGYYEARTFYSPDYKKSFAGSERPDLRTTLYWNPNLTTTNGRSKFSFFSADQASSYLIEIQGLTEDGIPFVKYSTFEVR